MTQITDGGGKETENECIEVVRIPVKGSKKWMLDNDLDLPPGLKFC